MSMGWVKLYRKLQDNPLWTCEPFSKGQAWVDLILIANHADNFFYKRGNKVNVKRGQVGFSEVGLADRWKWSRTKVRKFLNDLEKEQQIIQQKSNITQLITIVNYDSYQEKEQQSIQQKDSRKTAERQQKDTNKNVKNYKNVKNEKNISMPDGFDDVFIRWMKYKEERKDILTPSGISMFISKMLTQYGYSLKRFKDAVDNSIAMNYQGVFPPKEVNANNLK